MRVINTADSTAKPSQAPAPGPYSRKNPFPGRMLVNTRLSSPDSEKDTRHFEISFEGSGLSYEVGDSMAVYPTNDSQLVDEMLRTLGLSGEEIITSKEGSKSLRDALLRDYGIRQATPRFLKAIAGRASAAPLLNELLRPDRKQDLDTYLWGMDVIDFLIEHPSVKWSAEEFIALLPKLQPRLYSIASSLKAHPKSVHFIVDVVKYTSHGRARKGVCSNFLAERSVGSPVPMYPTVSNFRLPDDSNAPIIMVGPGTGVAPFRAYLQERQATGARGKAWLFFGAQREKSDYYYKEEFESLRANGVLTRIDTAFSRDQAHKIYVQDRMKESSAELWKWLEEGAYFYVCGDAKRMAKDVDATLRQIVQDQAGATIEQANEYVEKLKREKRYRRDVY